MENMDRFFREASISVELGEGGEEARGDGGVGGAEAAKERFGERELAGASEFEDEGMVRRVRGVEVGLERGEVEDFFGEKRV